MAGRRRNPNIDEFSTTEVAEAVGLSARNMAYLLQRDFIPVVSGGQGAGRHRALDYQGLERAAVISAFYSAGIELFLAGRLVSEIMEPIMTNLIPSNIEQVYFEIDGLVEEIVKDRIKEDPWSYHCLFTKNSEEYRKLNGAFHYDHLIEIFDRSYVFLNAVMDIEKNWRLQEERKTSPLMKIHGWKRGSSDVWFEECGSTFKGNMPSDYWQARQRHIGMVRINMSLAIRTAFRKMASIKGI